MRKTRIVGSRTGGQGKSTLAQLIALGDSIADETPQLVAIDTTEAEARSKLGKMCENVEELRIAPNLETLRRDSRALVAHWDRLGEIMLKGDAIIDVGANVISALLDWAVLRRAGDVLNSHGAPPIMLVVPIKAQAQAVEDALHLLERTASEKNGLPVAERVLVLNESGGTFERYGSSDDFRRIQAMKERHGLRIVRLAHCTSELWPTTERLYLPLREIIAMTTAEIEERFEMNPFAAAGAHADLLEWVLESQATLRHAGIVPAPPSTAKPDAASEQRPAPRRAARQAEARP